MECVYCSSETEWLCPVCEEPCCLRCRAHNGGTCAPCANETLPPLTIDQMYNILNLIEQNNVKILSTASESPNTAEGKIKVTLKLNVNDTARIRHILEHHGYHVVASFSSEEDDDDFRDRLQEFMRYLEV